MHTDQRAPLDCYIVLALQQELVEVELQRVVPIVGVGFVGDRRVQRFAVRAVLDDALGAFPIINMKRAFLVYVDHINGANDADVFVVDAPFGPVRAQAGRELCVELQELLELRGVVFERLTLVEMLDVGVHPRAEVGGLLPLGLDLFARHPVVSALRPVAPRHHFRDDGVRVERREQSPNEGGHRSKVGTAADRVLVPQLFKDDGGIPRVAFRQKLHNDVVLCTANNAVDLLICV